MSIRKGYVDTADGQVHYRYTTGGRGDPILFFHMTASSSHSFENMLQNLEGTRPLFAFDTPHYGQSFVPTEPASIRYLAEVLGEAIDNLGIDRFHCFGHHTGTNISGQLALMMPDRVRSLMLTGVSYTTKEENELYLQALSYDNPPDLRGTHIMRAWTRVAKDCEAATPYDPTVLWHPVPAEVFHHELIDTLIAGEKWYYGYQAVFTHDLIGTLEKVKCPIMLIAGSRDVIFHWHERAKKGLPHARVVERDGYGVYYLSYGAHDLVPFVKDFLGDVEKE